MIKMSVEPVAHYWFCCYKYHQYFADISMDHSRNSLKRFSRNPIFTGPSSEVEVMLIATKH